MSRIVVAGGGIAGLVVALFAARAGHDVALLEADDRPLPDPGHGSWTTWNRRGVPQFRQLHGYQARARTVLAARTPDLLARLHAAGAHEWQVLGTRPDARDRPDVAELVQVRCRRLVLEQVLREAVAAERTADWRPGVEVTGLCATGDGSRVVGLTTSRGKLAADLVVDATGRRSRVGHWCAAAGVASPVVDAVAAGQVYYTRWFRRPVCVGGAETALRLDLSWAALMLYPVDAGWFSATFFAPAHDAALRRKLMDPDGFDQAAALVDLLAEHAEPRALTGAFARWTEDHQLPWLRDTILLDEETNARWAGLPLPAPSPARPFHHADVLAHARTDTDVLVAYTRYRNLLDPPGAFWNDAEIADRVARAGALVSQQADR